MDVSETFPLIKTPWTNCQLFEMYTTFRWLPYTEMIYFKYFFLNPLSDVRLLAREKIYTSKRWEFLCNFTAKNDKISWCDLFDTRVSNRSQRVINFHKGLNSLDFLFLQHWEFWEHLVKLFFFSSLNYCNSLF